MSQTPSTPLTPAALDELRQLASEIHYAKLRGPDTATLKHAQRKAYTDRFFQAVERLAEVYQRHCDNIKTLPEYALGAIYEFNHSLVASVDFDVDCIVPIQNPAEPPSRYRYRIRGTRGYNFGQVPLLGVERVKNPWWDGKSSCSPLH